MLEHALEIPQPLAQVNLAKYTTWNVGGPADYFFQPTSVASLQAYLQSRPIDEPYFILGLGSNVLIRDGGIAGSVILMHNALKACEQLSSTTLRLEAGVTCAKAAKIAVKAGFSAGAFWAGVPGTIGGALAMNAGCWGHETWQFVKSVETVDRLGQCHERLPSAYQVGYRHVVGPQAEIFTAATFEFLETEAASASISELLQKRNQTQPIGVRTCGSVFKNPPGDHAARLIEAAGLKGMTIGGACVSLKHANFIVNENDASAADLEKLIYLIQQTVNEKFSVLLQPEVRIIGRTAGETHGSK